jgi:hypothetical protein
MSKAYYELTEQDIIIIKELIKKCKEVNLGNISFSYYSTSRYKTDINFYLTEYKGYWELVVKHEQKRSGIYFMVTDIYKINNNEAELQYDHSEEDME